MESFGSRMLEDTRRQTLRFVSVRVAATIREFEALQNFVLAKCTFGAADPTALLQLAAKEREGEGRHSCSDFNFATTELPQTCLLQI